MIAVFFVVIVSASKGSSAPLTPQEDRGKHIYVTGTTAAGEEMTALVGGAEVPAAALPCINCHGDNGQGKPEGGVTPTNITWDYLTKSYGLAHVSGRKHPAYTERSVGRAITHGIDPAGNRLAVAMPRYPLSQEDLADLISYLKRLGKELDPGLTETTIRLGTLLPTRGPLAELGRAMKAVMTAYLEEINERGGVYSRRIELQVVETDGTPSASGGNERLLTEGEPVFAMVGPFIAGAEKEMTSLLQEEEIPAVGPFTLFPQVGFPLNRYVFYLFSGLEEQLRAMVDFAAQKERASTPRTAIVYPTGETAEVLPLAIEKQCRKAGWNAVAGISYPSGAMEPTQIVDDLKQRSTELVFFLGSSKEARALMDEAAKASWTPDIFLLGSLAGKDLLDLPLAFQEKVFLSYPTVPSDQTRAGVAEYRALVEKHRLSARHVAAQLSALCAVKILVEGLKLAGKNLSREKLIETLEGLYQFDTGLTPPITYGRNRRIGALGAYVVSIDLEKKEFIPVSGWITPN